MFRTIINQLWKSEFFRNALTLVSGTTLAQAVSIVTAPILYRLYEREDYGTLGLYMAITGIIGPFSTMQYTHSILLEREDKNAHDAVWLTRIINITLSVITLIVIVPSYRLLGQLFNNPEIRPWLLILPLSIFFGGQTEILRMWANRKKAYNILTQNSMLTAFLVPAISIPLGIWVEGPLGLFVGLLSSQVLPTIVLGVDLRKRHGLKWTGFYLPNIKALAKRYIDFPKYSLPSDFINRFTNQLPVFMLSAYSGPAIVGVYNLTIRMLGLPISLISSAVSAVFRQKATEDFHRLGNCKDIFIKTLKSLVALSILPFLILMIFGPDIFALVFGEKWREAGVFGRILGTLFLFRFFVSPLSFLFYLRQKIKEDLFWHLWMLVSNVIIFYLGFEVLHSYLLALGLFCMNYVLIYIVYLYRSFVFSTEYIE